MNKPLCLLLIHGFGGSTKEVQPLCLLLERTGIPTFMVSLAGHCGEGKPIDNINYSKWIDSVREEILRLEQAYRVIPVGFSMGGLISVTLNNEHHFTGMVFINTPIYFWNLPQVAKNFIFDFKNARQYYWGSAGNVTLYTMIQFLLLLIHSHKFFCLVDCDSLVIQAKDDDSVWPTASSNFIRKKLQKEPEFYQPIKGGHQVLTNPVECETIAQKVAKFYYKLK